MYGSTMGTLQLVLQAGAEPRTSWTKQGPVSWQWRHAQLANPALRKRHWEALEELTGQQLNSGGNAGSEFKLSTLLEAGILEIAEDVEEIAGSAVKELAIEGKLNVIAD